MKVAGTTHLSNSSMYITCCRSVADCKLYLMQALPIYYEMQTNQVQAPQRPPLCWAAETKGTTVVEQQCAPEFWYTLTATPTRNLGSAPRLASLESALMSACVLLSFCVAARCAMVAAAAASSIWRSYTISTGGTSGALHVTASLSQIAGG